MKCQKGLFLDTLEQNLLLDQSNNELLQLSNDLEELARERTIIVMSLRNNIRVKLDVSSGPVEIESDAGGKTVINMYFPLVFHEQGAVPVRNTEQE